MGMSKNRRLLIETLRREDELYFRGLLRESFYSKAYPVMIYADYPEIADDVLHGLVKSVEISGESCGG